MFQFYARLFYKGKIHISPKRISLYIELINCTGNFIKTKILIVHRIVGILLRISFFETKETVFGFYVGKSYQLLYLAFFLFLLFGLEVIHKYFDVYRLFALVLAQVGSAIFGINRTEIQIAGIQQYRYRKCAFAIGCHQHGIAMMVFYHGFLERYGKWKGDFDAFYGDFRPCFFC